MFTETFVDIFVTHLRFYRAAKREHEKLTAAAAAPSSKEKRRRMLLARRRGSGSTGDKGSTGGNSGGMDDSTDATVDAIPTLEELFWKQSDAAGRLRGVCTDPEMEKLCVKLAE